MLGGRFGRFAREPRSHVEDQEKPPSKSEGPASPGEVRPRYSCILKLRELGLRDLWSATGRIRRGEPLSSVLCVPGAPKEVRLWSVMRLPKLIRRLTGLS